MTVAQTLKAVNTDEDWSDEVHRSLDGSNREERYVKLDGYGVFKEGW